MSKYSKKVSPNQLPLIPPESVLDKLDDRVRRTVINGEQWVSALDLLQYHGNKINPSLAWKRTIAFMNGKQGAKLGSNNLIEHQFEGKGQRKTPIINLEGFLRFAQSAEVPEWEFIRQLQADTTAEAIKSKKERKLESEIDKHDKFGLGDRPEIIYKKSKLDNLRTFKSFRDLLTTLAEKPEYWKIFSKEYIELFGMTAQQMEAMYKWKSVRDALPTMQLDYLTFAEKQIINVLQMQKAGTITNKQLIDTIELIVRPLGQQLRNLCDMLGIDHVSGKPLLTSGK